MTHDNESQGGLETEADKEMHNYAWHIAGQATIASDQWYSVTKSYGLNSYRDFSHGVSTGCGWRPEEVRNNPFVVPTKLMLAVSEIGEAMEGHRKNLQDDHLPHRPMIEVELADLLHRVFDLAGYLNLDLEGAYWEKAVYNQQRQDHKPENRTKPNGKGY